MGHRKLQLRVVLQKRYHHRLRARQERKGGRTGRMSWISVGLAGYGRLLCMLRLPDSPGFNAAAYLDDLVAKASLADLMKRASSLSADVGNLQSSRHSLVYHHHHQASLSPLRNRVRS